MIILYPSILFKLNINILIITLIYTCKSNQNTGSHDLPSHVMLLLYN
jgi:hypothetical protein